MYAELYSVWKRENEHRDLQELKLDFYAHVATYLKLLAEEGRMLDRKTVRAKLLRSEKENAASMVLMITKLRYNKLLSTQGHAISPATVLPEERMVLKSLSGCFDEYSEFAERLTRGQFITHLERDDNHDAFVVVRFLKDVPDLVGADMKTYGPFRSEDVASLPVGNSSILVRQGLAAKIEAK